MRSVVDDLRRLTTARVLEMSLQARIDLALALGDDDLEMFVRSSGLDRDEARRRLTSQRARGRKPSAAAIGRSR